MSSYVNETYLVQIPSNFKYLKEFEVYLKALFTNLVLTRAGVIVSDEDTIKVTVWYLPSFLLKEEFDFTEEFVEDLEKLDPENPVPVECTYVLVDLIPRLCEGFHIFKIKMNGNDYGIYFGVEENEYFESCFTYDLLLRTIDFGSTDFKPLYIFFPIMQTIKETLETIYRDFIEWREEQENVRKEVNNVYFAQF